MKVEMKVKIKRPPSERLLETHQMKNTKKSRFIVLIEELLLRILKRIVMNLRIHWQGLAMPQVKDFVIALLIFRMLLCRLNKLNKIKRLILKNLKLIGIKVVLVSCQKNVRNCIMNLFNNKIFKIVKKQKHPLTL